MTSRIAPDWLARRAELSPERVALRSGETSTSYRAWNDRVTQTARALLERGVKPGDRVAILAGNSETWLDVWHACGKMGAVLQALNWRLTPDALGQILGRGRPVLLLVDQTFAETGAQIAGSAPLEQLDALVTARDALSSAPLETPRPRLEDPWVLCYTGGTTGLPKAAVLTHENILWNAIGTAASWELHAGCTALLNAPLFHTGGMNVFTAPLIWVGGQSIVCTGFDVEQVLEHVDAGDITHFFGVPTMFTMIQSHERFDQTDFSKLELVISGGAPCPQPIFERFWAKDLDFKTGYGLTEAGPNNFWLPREQTRTKPGAVGYPLLHVEARLVDEDGAAAEGSDVSGELWLRGPHVVPGYFENPTASAEAIDEEGWLHTGDLAHRDAEGCYKIVGRKKDMYISGGENVYPAEIESVLHGHPSVIEAAVIGIPDPRWGEVGKAFVVTKSELDEAELSKWVEGKLAKYQRPRAYAFVDALPKTGAGKIDKKALTRD